jgi:hypothetical protein
LEHGQQQAGRFVFDVGQREGDQLGAAYRRGVAEQDDRGVASADGCAAVDAGDDAADLVESERSGQAAGCVAVGAAQPETDLAHGVGGDRVISAGQAVDVADRDPGQVDGDRRPGGQVGAQHQGVAGQGRVSRTVHQRSHRLQAWA